MPIEQIYETLVNDKSIISLLQLSKLFGFGSKKRARMSQQLYDKYTKEHIWSITKPRMSSHASKKQWETRSRVMPTEVRKRISSAVKSSWTRDDGTRREISKQNMIKNAMFVDKKKATQKAIITRRKRDNWANYTPESYNSLVEKNKNKIVTDETRSKQSVSAVARGRTLPIGFKHSPAALAKMSANTKAMWETGRFKRIYRSKASVNLMEQLQSLGYNVEGEYFISGRPFDIKINDCIIEFNGTYWHCDPRKYESMFYDKCRNCYAHEIWKRDEEKIELAALAGFRTYVVWQLDWQTTPNEVIENVRRFIDHI